MKKNFLIIIFSLLILILNEEYDLISGHSINIFTINSGITYKFYIEAEYKDDVKIEITSATNFSSDQEIYFYQYSERDSREPLYFSSYRPCYNICSDIYSVSDTRTTYVAFEIIPKKTMPLVVVKATVYDTTDNKILILLLIYFIVPFVCGTIIVILLIRLCCSYLKEDDKMDNPPNQEPNQPLNSNNTSQNIQNDSVL